jgi:hypothetical protein
VSALGSNRADASITYKVESAARGSELHRMYTAYPQAINTRTAVRFIAWGWTANSSAKGTACGSWVRARFAGGSVTVRHMARERTWPVWLTVGTLRSFQAGLPAMR